MSDEMVMQITRTFHLSVHGNTGKLEDLRYTMSRFKLYTQHFLTQLYFYPKKSLSTKGMGQLANQGQHKAHGILNAQSAATKETGNKSNIPQIKFLACPGSIEISKDSSFDYWVSFETQFERKRIRIPAKSHKRLNYFLKLGYALNPVCELVLQKNGRYQARVFVQKEVTKAKPREDFLGVDVGLVHAVSRSDVYLGKSLRPVICRQKLVDAERRRQGHSRVSVKTVLKQQLDIEVNRALTRCKRDSLSLAVEHPKTLANLRCGKLQGWARSYFARRATVRAEEESIWVTYVNPAYTSITCSDCGVIDKRSRVNRAEFKCLSCNKEFHADINASRNIARKGSASLGKPRQSGIVNESA